MISATRFGPRARPGWAAGAQDLTLTLIDEFDSGGFAATRPLVALALAKRAGKNRTEGTVLGGGGGADGAGKGNRTAKIPSDG